jgi:hypothetical protein
MSTASKPGRRIHITVDIRADASLTMTDSRARSGHGHRYQSPIATQDGRQLNGDSYGNYYAGDVHNYGRSVASPTLEG